MNKIKRYEQLFEKLLIRDLQNNKGMHTSEETEMIKFIIKMFRREENENN